MYNINIIIKDIAKKYLPLFDIINNNNDNYQINIYSDINIDNNIDIDVIIFGSNNIINNHIIDNNNIIYIYAPTIYNEDFINYPWITECWPLASKKAFRIRLEYLFNNIAKQKEAELNKLYLNSIIDLSPNMIWIKDTNGKHLLVNKIFRNFANKPNDKIIGKFHNDIWGLTEEQKIIGKCICTDSDAIVCALGWEKTFDEKLTLPNNIVKDLFTYKAPLRNKNNKIIGTIGIATDVTAQNIQKKKLEHAVSHDYLTDIYNRQYFMNIVNKNINDIAYTIYFFDLDNFKQINDTYSHQTGDKIITLFAIILQEVFSNCIVARYAGDEFIIAEPQISNINLIENKLKLLDEKLMHIINEDKRLEKISVSIGICSNKDTKNLDKIISLADIAMYRAKNIHKNKSLLKQYNKSNFQKLFYLTNEIYKAAD